MVAIARAIAGLVFVLLLCAMVFFGIPLAFFSYVKARRRQEEQE